MKKLLKNPYFYLVILLTIFLVWTVALYAQSYDYSITIKVEGKTLEQSMKIKQELTEYCKKNGISIEDYSKKEFDSIQKSRNIKKFQ
jgi:hypothetical protein